MNRPALFTVALTATALTSTVTGQAIELYSGAESKGLFKTSPAAFKYLDFAPRDVVTDTGSSFVVNAREDSDGGMGLFGIVGRNLLGKSPVSFDGSTHQLRVEYKFHDDNEAPTFKLVLNDQDDAGAGEQYKFVVAIDSDTEETSDGFSEIYLDISENDADHRNPGKDSGFSSDGDGIANYDLTQWQLQSVYGSSSPLHVEIRTLEIVEKGSNEPG